MSQQDEDPGAGAPGPSEGISSSRNVAEVSPSLDQKQELPLVAEARARDAAARAKLRGMFPRTMQQLEHGKRWWKAAAKLRGEVFPPKEGEGTE